MRKILLLLLVAPDQLLLSESACHRLGIVSYHPEEQLLRRHQLLEQAVANGKVITTKATTADATTDDTATTTTTETNRTQTQVKESTPVEKSKMPGKGHQLEGLGQQPIAPQLQQTSESSKPASGTVQMKLVRAVRLPANCSAVVPVQVTGCTGLALLEPKEDLESCLIADESLVEVGENGSTTMLIVNSGKLPCHLKKNTELAQAVEAELLDKADVQQELSSIKQNVDTKQQEIEMGYDLLRLSNVSLLPDDSVDSNERIKWRQQQLEKILIPLKECLSQEEAFRLSKLLIGSHEVFSLEDEERGETDLVEFRIDTGDATSETSCQKDSLCR